MTQRFKRCALLLLIATSSARGLTEGEKIGVAVAGTFFGILAIEHLIYPAITGKWERERQEQLAQKIAAQQARDRAYAQHLIADTNASYAPELRQLQSLTKGDLVTIITGKYGNKELKFFTYDQELEATLAKLAAVNISALEPAEQENFYALLTNIKELHRQKNLLLSAEITKQIEHHRTIAQQQARFNAEINTQQQLQALTSEVRGVVQEQTNNRSWMEAMFKDTTRASRSEGERTREQINNVVQTMHNKDGRDGMWQARQDDNWRRLQNDMRDRGQFPPPYRG
ncbi:MAG: hypothetical protein ACHQVS_03465 [Candidatus Babeliales bacterium]